MASPVTLFIVEGESRDLRFAEKMKDLFLKGRDDLRVICLPAAQNIYMLYERLAEEDFDLDVVEVLRETVPSAAKCLEGVERDSVDEVFLFFDYDSHQNNAPGCESDALVEAMLLAFDNEHESGKLYIATRWSRHCTIIAQGSARRIQAVLLTTRKSLNIKISRERETLTWGSTWSFPNGKMQSLPSY